MLPGEPLPDTAVRGAPPLLFAHRLLAAARLLPNRYLLLCWAHSALSDVASTFLRARLPSRTRTVAKMTCISQLHTVPCISTSGLWLLCSRCLESTRSLISLRICLIAPALNYALVECSHLILYLTCHLALEDPLATITAHGFCTAVTWLSPDPRSWHLQHFLALYSSFLVA